MTSNTEEQLSKPFVRRVAVVLFDGFTVLDVYGPVQALAAAGVRGDDGSYHRYFEIVTVASHAGPIRSGEGPTTVADYGFGDLPGCNILLIPGGMGTRTAVEDASLIHLIAEASRKSEITATVCTGTALLARTGLLDGRPATSNKMALDWVMAQGKHVLWKRSARWVDDGEIATSSGVSAGIDMALALIARLYGRETAERAASFMEYTWNDDPSNDPFAPIG
jgi:transcriptional regulator GlxA family with amidase domain